MFTFDTVVDQSVKTAKQALSFVQDETVRSEVVSLVEAQAEYTKTMYNTSVDLGKYFVEQFKNFDAKAFTFNK